MSVLAEAEGVVGAGQRGPDVVQHSVDDQEGWMLGAGYAAAGDMELVKDAGAARGVEAAQATGDERGRRCRGLQLRLYSGATVAQRPSDATRSVTMDSRWSSNADGPRFAYLSQNMSGWRYRRPANVNADGSTVTSAELCSGCASRKAQ